MNRRDLGTILFIAALVIGVPTSGYAFLADQFALLLVAITGTVAGVWTGAWLELQTPRLVHDGETGGEQL